MKKLNVFRAESGTSLIEFALVLPVLMFLLIGGIEVGRYVYYAIVAANAARAGVQYGIQGPQQASDTSGMESAASQDAMGLSSLTANAEELCSVDGGALQKCSTSSTPTSGTVYYVKVQVTGQYNPLINYPGIPTKVGVSGSAVMRVIYQ